MNRIDRLRIWGASIRYDQWLDLYGVRRRDRRELRLELRANLGDATAAVGYRQAIRNLGGVRHLAAQTSNDGELRSAWTAAISAAIAALVAGFVAFLLLGLYYAEGVLDAGSTDPVSGSLFPFIGSRIEVWEQPDGGGLSLDFQPGWLPLLLAVVVFVAVAKPWRSVRRTSRSLERT